MGVLDLPDELLLAIINEIPSRHGLSSSQLVNKRFRRLFSEHRRVLRERCYSQCGITLNGRMNSYEDDKVRVLAVSTPTPLLLQAFTTVYLPPDNDALEFVLLISRLCSPRLQGILLEFMYMYIGDDRFLQATRKLRGFYEQEERRATFSRRPNQEHESLRYLARCDRSELAEQAFRDYGLVARKDSSASLAQDIYDALRRETGFSTALVQQWAKRLVACYEQEGQAEEARKLTEDMFNALRGEIGFSTALVQQWAKRLAACYEQEGRAHRARKLTENVFDALRQEMGISAASVQLWAQHLVGCYDKEGRADQARRLTENVFVALRREMSISAASVQQWAKRLVVCYEQEERADQARKLTPDILSALHRETDITDSLVQLWAQRLAACCE